MTTAIKVLRVYANHNFATNDNISLWVSIGKNLDSDSYEESERFKLAISTDRQRLLLPEGAETRRPVGPQCLENLGQVEVMGHKLDINTKFGYEPGTWTLNLHAKSRYGLWSEIYAVERFAKGGLACFKRDQMEFQVKLIVLVPK